MRPQGTNSTSAPIATCRAKADNTPRGRIARRFSDSAMPIKTSTVRPSRPRRTSVMVLYGSGFGSRGIQDLGAARVLETQAHGSDHAAGSAGYGADEAIGVEVRIGVGLV